MGKHLEHIRKWLHKRHVMASGTCIVFRRDGAPFLEKIKPGHRGQGQVCRDEYRVEAV